MEQQCIVNFSMPMNRNVVKEFFVNLVRCDGRPVWSRTSDCQSGNPGSNPGRRIEKFVLVSV
jgi:hypothetical protein